VQADDHGVQKPRINLLGHELVQLNPESLDIPQDRCRLRREPQTPDAPILGIGAAFDKAQLLKAVDEASGGDRSDLGEGCEVVLGG